MQRNLQNEIISYSASNNNLVVSASVSRSIIENPDDTFFSLLPVDYNSYQPVVIKHPRQFFSSSVDYLNDFKRLFQTSSFIPTTTPLVFDDSIIRILIGESLTLECEIFDPKNSGYNVTWTRDNVWIQPSQTKDIIGNKLIIKSLSREDSGDYVCNIVNKYGLVSTEVITIEVIDPRFNPFFYRNLIKNPNGQLGTSNWNEINDGLAARDYGTRNFLQEQIVHDYDFNFTNSGYETITELINSPLIFSSSTSQSQTLGRYDENFFEEDTTTVRIPNSSSLFDLSIGPYKKYATFFPNPYNVEIDSLSKSPKQLAANLGDFFFTRPTIKYFRSKGEVFACSYQDIDLEDNLDILHGLIYGIKNINIVFFCYAGLGISRIKSNDNNQTFITEFDESGKIIIEFHSDSGVIHSQTQIIETPSDSEFFNSVNVNKSILDLRGASVVLGRQIFLPSIPNGTRKIRVKMQFTLHTNNQSNESIDFTRSDIYLGDSFNDTLVEKIQPYGLSRVMFTGLQLKLYPNDQGRSNLIL